ncbi:MAG: DUF4190 domain-containing protein [Aquihabitans sp.]
MTDEPNDEQIPGWPSPPASGASGGAPHDPTTPFPGSAVPGPPPAAPAPGSYPPPSTYPPPGGTSAPGGYAAPAPGYGPGGSSGAGYAPPAGYGYGPSGSYGGYAPARDHPQGTTILVLGICAWAVCGLCAPFAWVMGNNALKEIDRNPSAYSNRGMVQAGRILGMIYSILALLGIAFVIVLVIIGLASGTSSA